MLENDNIIDVLLGRVARAAGIVNESKTPGGGVSAKETGSGYSSGSDGDLRISKPLIRMQADIAAAKGKRHLSDMLRVASELAAIPEEELRAADALSGGELYDFAEYIEEKYQSVLFSEYLRRQVKR